MSKPLLEVKRYGKKILKRLKQSQKNELDNGDTLLDRDVMEKLQKISGSTTVQLKHCLHFLAIFLEFRDWQHCSRVLTTVPTELDGAVGSANTLESCSKEENMGTLWYSKSCVALSNQWFADYEEAKIIHKQQEGSFLLPYKNQYVIVMEDYLKLLGLSDHSIESCRSAGGDMVRYYRHEIWEDAVADIVRHKFSIF